MDKKGERINGTSAICIHCTHFITEHIAGRCIHPIEEKHEVELCGCIAYPK